MPIQKAVFLFYKAVRKIVRAAGLTKPVRRILGPLTGRLFLNLTTDNDGTFVIHGHRIVLASKGGYPPINMAMGKYEEETTRLLRRLTGPGMTVLDVGAHIGYYTLLAARQAGPEGKVYAFEPELENHALLLENIELNGYQNVVPVKMAVSDRTGTADLILTALDSGRHSMYHHGLPEQGSLAVETTTLDAFVESLDWPRIDLVKIDVEGAELSRLGGHGPDYPEKCWSEVDNGVQPIPPSECRGRSG